MSTERLNPNGLRLWQVDVRYSFVVAARSRREAGEKGERYAEEALGDQGPFSVVDAVWPVANAHQLDKDWRDALPYCDRDENPRDRTCAELLSDPPEPTEPELEAAGQARLFN